MWSSYEELQVFRACWVKEGEEIEERCNPSAATDDKLFARGSGVFIEGSTGEQQKRCLAFTQLITPLGPVAIDVRNGRAKYTLSMHKIHVKHPCIFRMASRIPMGD
jgi:hypothetical protein